ncbi:zinc-binding dehydrogenase [Dyadobacter sp. Leaf189]|uniref:zinc-binding dehydrogenase n=1 Tax=Dyadobacter sp. Leaf189 TaxID=1736295 RepID=UPI000B225678|nr:zinc-binding dehydrogenase [Dyadobacter sp. Leaf189]
MGVRRKARQKGIRYSFLFMQANGSQLAEITKLVESGVIKPVVDKVFPFEQTGKALEYVESGRAKGKVELTMK